MPIVLKQGSGGSTGNSEDVGDRTGSFMNAKFTQRNFISEALDLIEEDQATNTNDDGGDSSDEETRQKRT